MAVKGYVDELSRRGIFGWVFDEKAPLDPQKVEIYFDGRLVKTVTANSFRADLAKIHQNGNCAFSVVFFEGVMPQLPLSTRVIVKVQGEANPLPGSDKILQGDSTTRSIANALGEPYSLNKDNSLVVYFKDRKPDYVALVLDLAEKVIEIGRKEKIEIQLAYGSLLGAIRTGKVIPHDDDVDLATVFEQTSSEAVRAHFSYLLSRIRASGLTVSAYSPFQAHVSTYVQRQGVSSFIHVDLFCGWIDDSARYNLTFAIAGGVSKADILPTKQLEFEGRTFPAPYNIDGVCEAIYGPSWRTPDPGFRWNIPPHIKEYFAKLHVPLNAHVAYWNSFYAHRNEAYRRRGPSQFAAFALGEFQSKMLVIEAGCGDCKDAELFARYGHSVIALDASEHAVNAGRERLSEANLHESATVAVANIGDSSCWGEIFARIQKRRSEIIPTIYSRFFLHAIEENLEDIFLAFAKQALTPGERMYLEFRTEEDALIPKTSPPHYRRYVKSEHLASKLMRNGFEIRYFRKGLGYAKYGDEDAHVARLIVERI